MMCISTDQTLIIAITATGKFIWSNAKAWCVPHGVLMPEPQKVTDMEWAINYQGQIDYDISGVDGMNAWMKATVWKNTTPTPTQTPGPTPTQTPPVNTPVKWAYPDFVNRQPYEKHMMLCNETTCEVVDTTSLPSSLSTTSRTDLIQSASSLAVKTPRALIIR